MLSRTRVGCTHPPGPRKGGARTPGSPPGRLGPAGTGQVAMLLEEKGSLAEENRALREEKAQLEADAAGAAAAKKLLLLQTQVEQLQEENYR